MHSKGRREGAYSTIENSIENSIEFSIVLYYRKSTAGRPGTLQTK
jgi:hypothetical protein